MFVATRYSVRPSFVEGGQQFQIIDNTNGSVWATYFGAGARTDANAAARGLNDMVREAAMRFQVRSVVSGDVSSYAVEDSWSGEIVWGWETGLDAADRAGLVAVDLEHESDADVTDGIDLYWSETLKAWVSVPVC